MRTRVANQIEHEAIARIQNRFGRRAEGVSPRAPGKSDAEQQNREEGARSFDPATPTHAVSPVTGFLGHRTIWRPSLKARPMGRKRMPLAAMPAVRPGGADAPYAPSGRIHRAALTVLPRPCNIHNVPVPPIAALRWTSVC